MRFNSRIIFLLIVAVLIITSGLYIASQRNSPPPLSPTSESMTSNDGAVTDTTSSPSQDQDGLSTRYVEYSNENLTASANTRRVLFFYAGWCPTCRPVDESFQSQQDQIPADVTVIRVNYNDNDTDDDEKALADAYGVTYQHTFVQIDSEGGEVTKWNGGDLDTLLENIQ